MNSADANATHFPVAVLCNLKYFVLMSHPTPEQHTVYSSWKKKPEKQLQCLLCTVGLQKQKHLLKLKTFTKTLLSNHQEPI